MRVCDVTTFLGPHVGYLDNLALGIKMHVPVTRLSKTILCPQSETEATEAWLVS